MAVKNFEDLNVWKQARQITQEIYRLTKTEKFLKDFGLRDQIQRVAISVMSNIAEGFDGVEIQNSSSFVTLRKRRVVKSDRSSMSHSTRNTQHRMKPTNWYNRSSAYPE